MGHPKESQAGIDERRDLLESLDPRLVDAYHEAIEVLTDTGSVAYSRRAAEDLAAEARDAIVDLDLEPGPADQLARLPEFMIDREL